MLVVLLAAIWTGIIYFLSYYIVRIEGNQLAFVEKTTFFKEKKSAVSVARVKDSLSSAMKDAVEKRKLVIYPLSEESISRKNLDSLLLVYDLPINDSTIKESPYLLNIPIQGVYPLDAFFDRVYHYKKDSAQIRVAHYGDSQIEGGRMTSNIRDYFYRYFGGRGIGYVPLDDIASPVNYERSQKNFERFSIFKNHHKQNLYGPGGYSFSYSKDSGASFTLQIEKPYDNIKLIYGYGSDSSSIAVFDQDNKRKLTERRLNYKGHIKTEKLISSGGLYNYKFVFSGKSPLIYGFLIDGDTAIQFDNYGIRGQSGAGLLNINQAELTEMYDTLNTKFAIIQFGGNVVEYLSNPQKVAHYSDKYQNVFSNIKKALKDGSALVIGISDATEFRNGAYQSSPGISEFRYIQRKQAIESGMAFFDLYQFMGGEESNRLWNEYKLTSRDGHFGEKGRDLVCKEMVKALLFEYKKYCKRKKLTK